MLLIARFIIIAQCSWLLLNAHLIYLLLSQIVDSVPQKWKKVYGCFKNNKQKLHFDPPTHCLPFDFGWNGSAGGSQAVRRNLGQSAIQVQLKVSAGQVRWSEVWVSQVRASRHDARQRSPFYLLTLRAEKWDETSHWKQTNNNIGGVIKESIDWIAEMLL